MVDQTPIKITGKIAETDYVRAQWLHLRPRPVLGFLGVVLVLLLLAGGTVQVVGWLRGTRPVSDSFMLPFLASLLLLYFAFLTWRFRRSYRSYKAIKLPIEMELSEEGFHGKSEHGEARLPWEMFRKFKENKHMLLLYQSDSLFHVLPKRLFAGKGEVQRARDIVLRRVRSAT